MKRSITFLLVTADIVLTGCSASKTVKPATIFIKPNERITIAPFETENVLSNFGAQIYDEL